MGCAHKQNQDGFTLVEIAIVMIIIGLLVGGTFGGIRLVGNMKVQKAIQDLKSINSAALIFKDTYGRIPGDMPNASARLPDCTDAPCINSGDGDRQLDATVISRALINENSERFVFWHHLKAANLLSNKIKAVNDLNYGMGQPAAPLGGGYRIDKINGQFGGSNPPEVPSYVFQGAVIFNVVEPIQALNWPTPMITPCQLISSIDRKMDDGFAYNGFLQGWACATTLGSGSGDPNAPYNRTPRGAVVYDLKGF
ncbi:MAG: hypothetical protein BVN33_09785 [Proteobacteria bacterium ST_bin13]|nr:MAG: hypothetical protein BVN33_09785 [Proteobacteria bacterium ST_bin13]